MIAVNAITSRCNCAYLLSGAMSFLSFGNLGMPSNDLRLTLPSDNIVREVNASKPDTLGDEHFPSRMSSCTASRALPCF